MILQGTTFFDNAAAFETSIFFSQMFRVDEVGVEEELM